MKTRPIQLTDREAIQAREKRALAIREAERLWRHLACPAFCGGVSQYGRELRAKITAGILATFYGTRLVDKTK